VPSNAGSNGDLKHPDWRPDGRLLIAEGSCEGGIDLYTIDLNNNRVKVLWDGGLTEGYPRWFADGRHIAFHQIDSKRNARLFMAQISSDLLVTDVHLVSSGPFDIEPSPSPDGKRLAYSNENVNGLSISLLDPLSRQGLGRPDTGYDEQFPSWHPDGNTLIFHARTVDGTQIWSQKLTSGELSRLTVGPGPNFNGDLSSDGRLLAFASERDGDREIYLRDLSSGNVRRVTNRAGRDGYPKFSPDGKKLAFHSVIDGQFAVIRIVDLDTEEIAEFSCQNRSDNSAP